MMVSNLPFAHGRATFICPFYPTQLRPGRRRYRPQIAVSRAQLFTWDEQGEFVVQATFFDRAAIIPWAQSILGTLKLQYITAASPQATWQQQRETVEWLCDHGLLTDGEGLALERDLRRHLLRTLAPKTLRPVNASPSAAKPLSASIDTRDQPYTSATRRKPTLARRRPVVAMKPLAVRPLQNI